MKSDGFCLFDTPIGACAIAWRAHVIAGVLLPEDHGQARSRSRMQREFPDVAEAAAPAWVHAVIDRVRKLLEGGSDDLSDVPLDLERVPEFNRRVYEITRAIAPGQTLTYGQVATKLGEPGAARAVGQALGHNPFAPSFPATACWRRAIVLADFRPAAVSHQAEDAADRKSPAR